MARTKIEDLPRLGDEATEEQLLLIVGGGGQPDEYACTSGYCVTYTATQCDEPRPDADYCY